MAIGFQIEPRAWRVNGNGNGKGIKFDPTITWSLIVSVAVAVGLFLIWVFDIRDAPAKNSLLIEQLARGQIQLREDYQRDVREIKEDVRDIRDKMYSEARDQARRDEKP